jgi:hypothetical protein
MPKSKIGSDVLYIEVPEGLKDRLKRWARDNGQRMTDVVIEALQQHMAGAHELPGNVKRGMERLAQQHRRQLDGEVIVACDEYLARHSSHSSQDGKGGRGGKG